MECRLGQRSICTPSQISRYVCRVVPSSITLLCCHRFPRDFQQCPAVCRRWVEARVIRRARLHGLLHGVVNVEDHALGAVLATRLLVLAFDKGEGCPNAVPVVAPDAVEVEGGRVRLP
jgi:hypothetical protein